MSHEIDQLLRFWQNQLDTATQNLLELQELPTYQRLCNTKLTGMTATKVTPALAAMNDLFQYFDLLVQTVNKASQLRQQLPKFLASEQKIDEIKKLLNGASIELSGAKIPLAKRQLLTVNNQINAITPNQLLEMMIHGFSIARDAVLEVDGVWEKLDHIIFDMQTEVNYLQELATSVGENNLTELNQAKNHLNLLQQRTEEDPLGIKAELQQIHPLLRKTKAKLEQICLKQQQLRDKLAASDQLWEELQENHRKSLIIFAECREKITDHSITQVPLTAEEITVLNQWLMRLKNKLEEGLVDPIIVGLDNWLNKAKEYNLFAHNVYLMYSNLLQNRQELRGRLDALQAKALAKGLIEDTTLTNLAETAINLLYTRPTAINQANQLVSQYEKMLTFKLKN